MVNGKPTLTFGDGQLPSPSQVRQRAGRASSLGVQGPDPGSFASFLPAANKGGAQKAPQQRSGAGFPTAQPQAAVRGQAGAQSMGLAEGYGTGMSYNPATLQSGSPTVRAASLPAGRQSRSDARVSAQTSVESLEGMNGMPRFSAKNAPRLSGGVPITGRNALSMPDRGAIPGRSTLTGRGGMGYASPTANAMQAQMLGVNPQGQGMAYPGGGAGPYANFGGRGGAPLTGQSFVTHGFSGDNAELALRSLGYDMKEARPVATFAKVIESDPAPLKTLNSLNSPPPGVVFGSTQRVRFPSGEEGALTALQVANHRKKGGTDALMPGGQAGRSFMQSFYDMAGDGVGALAAKFESGSDGISAIGYDRNGGTSYGKYQIASRVGTMRSFIDYLGEKAPDLAKRLSDAGPANTGSRSGRMPDEWKKIAEEDPGRFEELQSDFIRTSHFEPAMQSIAESTGVAFENMPMALQEVLFSTAVQHGPAGAARIISQAVNSIGSGNLLTSGSAVTESFKKAGRQLIKQIYALRASQFMSSTARVQASAQNRLRQEMQEALTMLS